MSADRRVMLFLRLLDIRNFKPVSSKLSAITKRKALQGGLVRERSAGEEPFLYTEFILTPKGKRTLEVMHAVYLEKPHHDFGVMKRVLAGEEYPDWLIPRR